MAKTLVHPDTPDEEIERMAKASVYLTAKSTDDKEAVKASYISQLQKARAIANNRGKPVTVELRKDPE